jgi:hypothetical protein
MTNPYTITKGGYVAFDAMSLKQLILDRLNEQKIFTDQNFIGSNLSTVIDIVAYAFNTLMYYLNRTSSESMFTEAQLYENINKIVKLIDYNPVGFQTSTLSFTCSATGFNQGLYTIPRYSFITINNIPFTFNEDIVFNKNENNITEFLQEISNQKLLYQGVYQEYPLYTALGENYETIIVNTGDELVDHFNIDVYVKDFLTGKWEQYDKTANLYLENNIAKKYELRLNGNKRYEVKFGNNINGRKLSSEDQVAIYYLSSAGEQGIVGPNALQSSSFVPYDTAQYNEIINDILKNQYRIININETQNLLFNNSLNSTPIKEAETPEEIRQRAPSYYKFQYRLVTNTDYETFIKTNFANLIHDVVVINNWEYTSSYLKYFYDIGLQDPLKTERALINQILYADSCNFNNIYFIVVPRSNASGISYLAPAQKELINLNLLENKITTLETVFVDPVYKYINLGITDSASFTDFDPEIDEDFCRLEVIKRSTSRADNETLKNSIVNIFKNYFDRSKCKLGQLIDLKFLNQQILNLEGVQTFYTTRSDSPSNRVEGLSFFAWNSLYPSNDKLVTTNDIILQKFEFPYFNNIESIYSRIDIIATNQTLLRAEY